MGIALAVILAALGGAHVWLVAGLARRQAWWRAALALLLPPLAPSWGWGAGLRAPATVWGIALALYALAVALTGR